METEVASLEDNLKEIDRLHKKSQMHHKKAMFWMKVAIICMTISLTAQVVSLVVRYNQQAEEQHVGDSSSGR